MRNSLRKIFEDEEEKSQEIEQTGNIAKSVFDFIRKKITRNELIDSDGYIEDVSGYSFDRRNSTIYTMMTVNDFYEIIDLREEDKWVIDAVGSYYSDFNVLDPSTAMDDFEQGYNLVWDRLDNENMEILRRIAGIVYPEEPFYLDSEDYRYNLNNRLLNLFKDETKYIVYEFAYSENDSYVAGLKNAVNRKFWGPLKESGIELDGEYLSITAGYIIMFARLLNYYGDLEGMMQRIIKRLLPKLETNWSDSQWEYYDPSSFDLESFNNTAFTKLNDIEDILLEKENFGEYIDLLKRIQKKYNFNRFYKIPKNPNRNFSIIKIDPDTLEIEIKFQNKMGTISTTHLSEEDFNSFLYNYDLFDLG